MARVLAGAREHAGGAVAPLFTLREHRLQDLLDLAPVH
jgi:hypothetical protein